MSAAKAAYAALSAEMLSHEPECHDDARFTADSLSSYDMAEMKLICHTCPLFQACKTYAREERPKGGFWAGRPYPFKKGNTDV